MTPAVELCGLTKEFVVSPFGARLRAVDRISLRVAPGRVLGLVGANGSGKSTLLRLVVGLVRPTSGTALVFGAPSEDPATRRDVGYLPESPTFHRFLTGRELVELHGHLAGLRGLELRGRTAEALARVGLESAKDRKLGQYSKGMLQRIGFAQAWVGRPRLLVLDEPTANLDRDGVASLLDQVRELRARGVTVLLTSHRSNEIDAVCDEVVALDAGRSVPVTRLAANFEAREELIVAGPGIGPEDQLELDRWAQARGHRILSRAGDR